MPPVTFSPTEFELPDIDIWQQPKPFQETFPPPIVYPLPDWTAPEIMPYNPPPITLDPIPDWTAPDNFIGTMPDITPYSPPPTTFEIPDFNSLNTQSFTAPTTNWP